MNTYQKQMVHTKHELARLYGARCMLTGIQASKFTYHHTNDKNCGENRIECVSIENGTIMLEFIHCYFLHCVIERQSMECYEAIRLTLNDYKEAIDNGDLEFVQMYEQLLMPVFAEFQRNQKQTKRRFRKI